MSGHGDVVDPVEAVGGVNRSHSLGGSAPVASANESKSSGKSDLLFHSNYVLEVMKYTNLAMKHQSDIVALRGEVAQLGTRIAGDLATISQFISKVQSEAHSGGQYQAGNGVDLSPDAFIGMSYDFYHVEESDPNHFGADDVPGCVSPAYESSMKSFVNAVKDLYYSSTTGVGPTVGDLSTIANPAAPDGSKDFNMAEYFGQIKDSYKQYNLVPGCEVVSTTASMHPSLLQQYMYAKAQLTVHTATPQALLDANGKIENLVNFKNGDDGFDSDLTPFMQVLDSLNQSVSVKDNYGKIGWEKATTDNILHMILLGKFNNTFNGLSPGEANHDYRNELTHVDPGLYAAFGYMAYNYIWTKNPNLDTSGASANSRDITQDVITNDSFLNKTGWNYYGFAGVPQGDPLSALNANVTSCQANFSATGNATGTSFTQDVNSLQQYSGAAGKIADGYAQGQETLIRNFKS